MHIVTHPRSYSCGWVFGVSESFEFLFPIPWNLYVLRVPPLRVNQKILPNRSMHNCILIMYMHIKHMISGHEYRTSTEQSMCHQNENEQNGSQTWESETPTKYNTPKRVTTTATRRTRNKKDRDRSRFEGFFTSDPDHVETPVVKTVQKKGGGTRQSQQMKTKQKLR